MTLTPAQAVAQVDSPRHDWDELSDHYKRHCRQIAAAAIAAHKVLEADVPLAPPEWMPPAPSFHAERDGTLGEVEVGDRVMWCGQWCEATAITDHSGNQHISLGPDQWWCAPPDSPARIQKRATVAEGPPAEMRLPGGDVAYQTIRAGEVVPGMWVEHMGQWMHVVTCRPWGASSVDFIFDGNHGWAFSVDKKVKVASTVDGARLAAERQAQRDEAYDTACEART